jgi:hypothetical protein
MQSEQPATAPDTTAHATIIQRHKHNPRLWEVRLRSDVETYWVERLDNFYLPLNAPCRVLCSCTSAEPANCTHARALQIHLLQEGEKAQARRVAGLRYSGLRVTATQNDGVIQHQAEPQVSVWQGEEAKLLDPKPSQALRNHSPDGFEWGYAGSGPAQLALAILLDYTGDATTALDNYQDFKFAFIAGLRRDSGCWQIAGEQIRRFLFRKLNATSFEYHDFHGTRSHCYLRWLTKPQITGKTLGDDNIIVIATVKRTASGAAEVGHCEHLANQVCRELEIAPEHLIWIEQYFHDTNEVTASRCDGHFRLVAFHVKAGRLRSPQWLQANRTFVENLIGQPLLHIPNE